MQSKWFEIYMQFFIYVFDENKMKLICIKNTETELNG